jgi:hypothetical protein
MPHPLGRRDREADVPVAKERIDIVPKRRSRQVTELGPQTGENPPDFAPITAVIRYGRCHWVISQIAYIRGVRRIFHMEYRVIPHALYVMSDGEPAI